LIRDLTVCRAADQGRRWRGAAASRRGCGARQRLLRAWAAFQFGTSAFAPRFQGEVENKEMLAWVVDW